MDASEMEDATRGGTGDLPMMTFEEVAGFLGAEPARGSAESAARQLTGVSAPEVAREEHIVFAQDGVSLRRALLSDAGAILANESLRSETDGLTPEGDWKRVLWVRDARLCFARIGERLRPRLETSAIDASARISPGAMLGRRLSVGPGAVIEGDVVVGDDCHLGAHVVVHAGTTLGCGVMVKAGAVLGSAGFGFVRDAESGAYVPFPQQGRLVIEDDVWIGANATIDRGALGETRIGHGTKIDNLVHVAHNCTIGCNVVVAAQTGIAGSSVVGDGAVIAGQVGIADHVTIGEGVILGAKAGVPSNKNLQGAGQVFWGIPARPIQQYLRELAQLKRSAEKKEPDRDTR